MHGAGVRRQHRLHAVLYPKPSPSFSVWVRTAAECCHRQCCTRTVAPSDYCTTGHRPGRGRWRAGNLTSCSYSAVERALDCPCCQQPLTNTQALQWPLCCLDGCWQQQPARAGRGVVQPGSRPKQLTASSQPLVALSWVLPLSRRGFAAAIWPCQHPSQMTDVTSSTCHSSGLPAPTQHMLLTPLPWLNLEGIRTRCSSLPAAAWMRSMMLSAQPDGVLGHSNQGTCPIRQAMQAVVDW